MRAMHRDANGNVYLKCWDEWDKYSVVLTPADRAGLNHVAYKVEHDSDLDVLEKRIRDWGVPVQKMPEGALPFCGRSLRFDLPSGHPMYLFAQKEFAGKDTGSLNPDPWPDDIRGAGVHWLGPCLLMGELGPEEGVDQAAESTPFLMETHAFQLRQPVVVR